MICLGLGTGVLAVIDCHAEGVFVCWRIGTWIGIGVVGWWAEGEDDMDWMCFWGLCLFRVSFVMVCFVDLSDMRVTISMKC